MVDDGNMSGGTLQPHESSGPPATLEEALERIVMLEDQLDRALFDAGVLRLQLDMLSSTDTITGLPNVNGIMQALDKASARADRSGERFGLMAVDLPVLSRIVELYGEEMFDDAIRHGGALVTACLRRLDTVGRMDDVGFLIVLPMLSEEGVKAVTSRIEQMLLRTPFEVEDDATRLMPAFTLVLSNPDGPSDPQRMLKELAHARERSVPGAPVVIQTMSHVDGSEWR